MQSFLEQSIRSKHEPTVGVEFGAKIIEVKSERIKLQIWDTAGSENYRSITRSYYRAAAGAVLVYDITRRQTFDHLGEWLDEARINGNPNISVVIVGNKLDLHSERQVSTEEAKTWATDNGLLYLETSAKNGQGVFDTFFLGSQDILDKINSGLVDLQNQAFGITVKKKPEVHQKEKAKCCTR
jgi:Ras-related protein Rab-2A